MVIAQPTPEEPRPRLGLVRLRFGSDLEPAFREYHFHQSLVFMRLALVLGAVLYALFGVLDLFIVPDAARSIWLIRYAVVCPAVLAVLGLTYTRWFQPVAQPLLCALTAVGDAGSVAQLARQAWADPTYPLAS